VELRDTKEVIVENRISTAVIIVVVTIVEINIMKGTIMEVINILLRTSVCYT
jgi:hypothetical protein